MYKFGYNCPFYRVFTIRGCDNSFRAQDIDLPAMQVKNHCYKMYSAHPRPAHLHSGNMHVHQLTMHMRK